MAGVRWAAVEWSERRQAWCIEDAEGHCFRHRDHIHDEEVGKNAAVMLATAMIRNGRMPTPAEASQCRKDRLQRRRQRPSEQRRRQRRKKEIQLLTARWRAEREEFSELPLCEVLADAFDLDPNLGRSNSFASLRPRLISCVEHRRVGISIREPVPVHLSCAARVRAAASKGTRNPAVPEAEGPAMTDGGDLCRGERATWGSRLGDRVPATAPDRTSKRLLDLRRVRKGALRGFCRIELPNRMRVSYCPVLVSNGKAWATLPSKPVLDQDRRQKVDGAGKRQFGAIVEWRNRALANRFSDTLIALLRDAHPGALD
jgi:hypothetical protein